MVKYKKSYIIAVNLEKQAFLLRNYGGKNGTEIAN